MDLKKKLEEAKTRRKELVEQANSIGEQIDGLRNQRQLVLQEALKCDGEVRVLEELVKEEKGK